MANCMLNRVYKWMEGGLRKKQEFAKRAKRKKEEGEEEGAWAASAQS